MTIQESPRRSRNWLCAALLLVGTAASACSPAAGSPAASPAAPTQSSAAANTGTFAGVTLHVGDQAGAGAEALLTAAGLINKLPFKVVWSNFTSGPPMLQAMGAGSVDIGSVGDAPPIFAAAGHSPIAVVSALQANPLGSAILVPKNSPIRTVAQLRGKKIAVTQGSSANYHLLAILKKAKLTIRNVTPDYLQPPDAEAAFSGGQVDAWDVWSPFVEQVVAQQHARILASGAGIGTTYSFVVASRAALADPARARAIGVYLGLLDQAYAWAATHQSIWAATWSKATGLPAGVMLQAVRDSLARPAPITRAVLNSEQQISNTFTAAGLIPGHVNFASFATTTYNHILGGSR